MVAEVLLALGDSDEELDDELVEDADELEVSELELEALFEDSPLAADLLVDTELRRLSVL